MDMEGLIYAENNSQFEDCLGFIQRLEGDLGEKIKLYGYTFGDKVNIKGFIKIFRSENGSTESIANTLSKLVKDINPDIIAGPSLKNTNEIASRLAAEFNYPMITEVNKIIKSDNEVLLQRQIIGGRGIIIYPFKTPIVVTVPTKKFKPSPADEEPSIEEIPLSEGRIEIIEKLPKEKGAVDIESTDIVVGVGRGFKSKDDIKIAFELASLIGGEVGCSRPVAADLRWLGEDRWIGISGKKIKGKLYMAIGISGAPQHIMAANDSKIIVAVNKDKNAPIFKYADYGVIADLYQFIPVLIKKLKEKRK